MAVCMIDDAEDYNYSMVHVVTCINNLPLTNMRIC